MKVFYEQKASKNEMVKQIVLSTNWSYQQLFLKVTVLIHLRKQQWSASFVKHTIHSLILAENEQKWNVVSTNEIYQ